MSVYKYTFAEAKRLDELDDWRESHDENVKCARQIEEMIKKSFDGMHLKSDIAKDVCIDFGVNRVAWVLANTIKENSHDGRFRSHNKEWANTVEVLKDSGNYEFSVTSHPEIVNGLVDQYRRYLKEDLKMLDASHCLKSDSGQNYTNKLLIMKPYVIADEYQKGEYQLFFAENGFGCNPGAIGKQVYGKFITDGEFTHFGRRSFMGVADESKLPDWASKIYDEFKQNNLKQDSTEQNSSEQDFEQNM